MNEKAKAGTYFEVRQKWCKGDVIELEIPMNVRLVEGNPLVEEIQNQIAIMRGPLVYCLESVDLPRDVKLSEIYIPANIDLTVQYEKDLMRGIAVLEGEAEVIQESDWSTCLYRPYQMAKMKRIKIRMIPYYAWANRGITQMSVWLPLYQ